MAFDYEGGQGVVLSWGWGRGGGGGIRSCAALFWEGGLIRPLYEACTDDVDAAYSKFEYLGSTRQDKEKPACSVFTPPFQLDSFYQLFSRFPDKSERRQPEQGWRIQK